jgi:hypothetical protein
VVAWWLGPELPRERRVCHYKRFHHGLARAVSAMTTATTPFDLLSAEVFRRVVCDAADRVGDVRSMALTSRQWRDEVASLFPAAGMDFWLLRELFLFWRRSHTWENVADAPLARWFSQQGLATVEDLAGVQPDFHSSMAAEAGVRHALPPPPLTHFFIRS